MLYILPKDVQKIILNFIIKDFMDEKFMIKQIKNKPLYLDKYYKKFIEPLSVFLDSSWRDASIELKKYINEQYEIYSFHQNRRIRERLKLN